MEEYMVKRFASYYKNHMGLFIIDMIAAILMSSLELVLPFISGKFLDDYIPDRNMAMIIQTALILLGLYVLRIFMQIIVNYYGHIMGTRIEHDMRGDLFKKIENLNYSYFNDNKTGTIMSRLVGDLRDIAEMAHHVPEDILISIMMLIGALAFIFSYSVALALLAIVFMVLLLAYSFNRRVAMLNGFRKVRREHAEINSQIESSVGGIRLTQSFTNENYEYDKFSRNNQAYRESWREAYKAMTTFSTGNDFIINIFYLSMLVFGGYLLYNGEISEGNLLSTLLFVNYLIQPIRRLINSIQQIQTGLAGFERFTEIMDMQPEIQNPMNPIFLEQPKGLIEFKNVNFKYNQDDKLILRNFSFRIEPGRSIALVGETGVGKSTISQLIPRFYDVTDGEILIDGVNVKRYDLTSLRKAIGHVQQDVYIFYGTVKDNILYGRPDATEEEVLEAAKKARLHDFIMTLDKGYDTLVGERGVKLSGGQKQRISIARVFLKNPPILILDEATSSLDNITERKIQDALDELAKGRTSIVIAHRLTTIRDVDEIIVLDNQGIAERGTHHDLIHEEGYYASLYNIS
jgi:ATP-binding cassette, subfamily B, bacterial